MAPTSTKKSSAAKPAVRKAASKKAVAADKILAKMPEVGKTALKDLALLPDVSCVVGTWPTRRSRS